MATISIVRDGGRATIFASVFPVNELNPDHAGEFVFEILEGDGKDLERHFGQKNLLSLDGEQVFWGELVSLTPCTSTVPGLALMRDRPTLRGVLRVHPDSAKAVN